MRFILIGNFLPDSQESMIRFAQMLRDGFCAAGHPTEIWHPKAYFSKHSISTLSGLGKWLGYIDKWLVFPLTIRWRLFKHRSKKSAIRFHICDHSNSPYLAHLPKNRTAITCHDVLAIRGAFGHADAYCPASMSGKILQRWILGNLKSAQLLAAVTQNTLSQLIELDISGSRTNKSWSVIPNGFNGNFRPMDIQRRNELLNKVGVDTANPFLLCVGSGQQRKNRQLLLDMVVALGNQWTGKICFAGQAPDKRLMEYAKLLNLTERITVVEKPNHETLVALYSGCKAFVFPSLSEGFGWPVIEAQACGVPVIASDIAPMPEVGGAGAIYADPRLPSTFAEALLSLSDDMIKTNLIDQGFVNTKRFRADQIINMYLALHQQQV